MSSQIEGVPDGFELIAIRKVRDGEFFIGTDGFAKKWILPPGGSACTYPVLRKIEKPKQYRPFANAAEYMPHWGKPIRERQHPEGFDSIVSVSEYVCYVCMGDNFFDFDFFEMFNKYEFADGTPFGIEVQE